MLGQLFGSKKLAILSKQDIKYEGTLVSINNDDQSIQLKDVKSYGTEGRRPGNEIPPSSVIYDLINFKGSDIKQLWEVQPEQLDSSSILGGMPGQPPQTGMPGVQPPLGGQGLIGQPPIGVNPGLGVSPVGFGANIPPYGANPLMGGPLPTSGLGGFPGQLGVPPANLQQQFGNSNGDLSQQAVSKETKNDNNNTKKSDENNDKQNEEDDLDFEQMNDKFQRVEINEEKEEEYQQKQYKKTGFFDTISNTTDTKSQRESKDERQQAMRCDNDTFGEDYVQNTQMSYTGTNHNRRYNHNNQRGGRGGRGGFNNNRGGYNNNNNYNNNRNYNNNYNNNNNYRQYNNNRNNYNNNNDDNNNNDNNNNGLRNNNYNNNNRGGYNNNNRGGYNNNRGGYNNNNYNNNNRHNNNYGNRNGNGQQNGGGPKPYIPKRPTENNDNQQQKDSENTTKNEEN